MYEENESLDMEQDAGVVDPEEDEAAAQGAEDEESSGDADRGRQSHEDNRRYQAARRAGEQAGYDRAMAEVSRRISRSGMRDPSTGEAIRDLDGIEAYSKAYRTQQIAARAKAEGRSVAEVTEEEDNRDFIREQRQKAAEEKKREDAQSRQQAWIARDAAAFAEAYPDVDLKKLDGDAAFRRFCGSRYGREPLAELYEDYMEITGGAAQAAVARAGSKAARATGSGGGEGEAARLTAAQQRALDEWNRENPRMKMTAKEFLSR